MFMEQRGVDGTGEAEVNRKGSAAPGQFTVGHMLELTCNLSSQKATVASLF